MKSLYRSIQQSNESILDSDEKVVQSAEERKRQMIKDWIMKYIWVDVVNSSRAVDDFDYELKGDKIYIVNRDITGIRISQYDFKESSIPKYIKFANFGKTSNNLSFNFNSGIKDISQLFKYLDRPVFTTLFIAHNDDLKTVGNVKNIEVTQYCSIVYNKNLTIHPLEMIYSPICLDYRNNKNKVEVEELYYLPDNFK